MKKIYPLVVVGGLLFVIAIILKFGGSASTLNIFVIEYAVFAYLGLVAYIIYDNRLRKKKLEPIRQLTETQVNILDLTFVFLLFLIVISLRNALYVKPLSYYVLTSLAVAVVGLQILLSPKIQRTKMLIQILSLAAIIRFSSPMINPCLIGWDAYWHYNQIAKQLVLGRLDPSSGHYYYYPFFHIVNIIPSLLVGLSEGLLNWIGLFNGLLAILVIYYIVRELSNEKAGLTGALILTVSTLHIYRSIGFARPEITFILFSLLAILKAPTYKVSRSWVLFWISAISVFFIHPTATVTLIAILAANFILKNIQSYSKNVQYAIKITPFVSYTIGYISYLVFVHYSLFVDMVQVIFIPDEEVAPMITVLSEEAVTKITGLYYLEVYLSFLGMSMILFLGVIGSLKWLSGPSSEKLTAILGILFVYFLPVYYVLTDVFEAQPSRFLVYGNVLTIIPASVGMLMFFNALKGSRIAIVLFLLIFSFFSLTSHLTGDDNGIFNRELLFNQRHATESIVAIYPFINEIKSKPLFVDDEAAKYLFSGDRGIVRSSHKFSGLSSISIEQEGFFVINFPKIEKGFVNDVKLERSFVDNFANNERVYDNGNVVIFRR